MRFVALVLLLSLSYAPVVAQQVAPPGSQVDWGNPINRGLRNWYLFNEGAGNQLFNIVSTDHSVLTNMDPANDWSSSPVSGSLDFDNSNDYVFIAADFMPDDQTDDYTVSTWANLDSLGDEGILLWTDDADTSEPTCGLRIFSSELRFFVRNDAGSTQVDLDLSGFVLGEWQHLAGTKRGDVYTSYLNGVEQDTTMVSPSGTFTRTILVFGAHNQGGTWNGFADGRIANGQTFDRGLTGREVQELYNNPLGGLLRRNISTLHVPAAPAPSTRRVILIGETTKKSANSVLVSLLPPIYAKIRP